MCCDFNPERIAGWSGPNGIVFRSIAERQQPKNLSRAIFGRTDVDVGPDTEFIDVLPFTISTVDELLERYDDLHAYFRTWPTKEHRGTHKHSDGIDRFYYVEFLE
jgi:hypothetical protein